MPDAAARSGVRVHLVGGSVRDLLLGRTPAELDLAASGEGDDPVGSLAGALGGVAMKGSQFGTAKVVVGEVEVDVARTRRETYIRPGALPTVTFTNSIEEDLPRRDFTIHAMAVSLNRGDFGAVLDPLDGRRDLEAGRVRVLHARSFEDDPTRILRAVRYAGRLGFEIEGRYCPAAWPETCAGWTRSPATGYGASWSAPQPRSAWATSSNWPRAWGC